MPASPRPLAQLGNSAPVFAALGDATRLHLVSRLCDRGPLSITRLASGSRMSRQAITKHLVVMEKVGLVHGSRRGREMIWELDANRLDRARRQLELISQQWDGALERLRKFVED